MSVINKSIVIKAPVSKVFGFVTNPENWTRYVTSLVEVNNLSPDAPKKGSTFKWAYRMMGVKFRGKGTVTDNVKNKRFALSLEGKHPVSETYEFSDKGDGSTELKVKVEYEIPSKVFSAIADKLVVQRLNAIEARNVLEKIKLFCEGT
jgi:uncharacterized membrane protein